MDALLKNEIERKQIVKKGCFIITLLTLLAAPHCHALVQEIGQAKENISSLINQQKELLRLQQSLTESLQKAQLQTQRARAKNESLRRNEERAEQLRQENAALKQELAACEKRTVEPVRMAPSAETPKKQVAPRAQRKAIPPAVKARLSSIAHAEDATQFQSQFAQAMAQDNFAQAIQTMKDTLAAAIQATESDRLQQAEALNDLAGIMQERVNEQFDRALAQKDFATARTILDNLRARGFTAVVRLLEEKIPTEPEPMEEFGLGEEGPLEEPSPEVTVVELPEAQRGEAVELPQPQLQRAKPLTAPKAPKKREPVNIEDMPEEPRPVRTPKEEAAIREELERQGAAQEFMPVEPARLPGPPEVVPEAPKKPEQQPGTSAPLSEPSEAEIILEAAPQEIKIPADRQQRYDAAKAKLSRYVKMDSPRLLFSIANAGGEETKYLKNPTEENLAAFENAVQKIWEKFVTPIKQPIEEPKEEDLPPLEDLEPDPELPEAEEPEGWGSWLTRGGGLWGDKPGTQPSQPEAKRAAAVPEPEEREESEESGGEEEREEAEESGEEEREEEPVVATVAPPTEPAEERHFAEYRSTEGFGEGLGPKELGGGSDDEGDSGSSDEQVAEETPTQDEPTAEETSTPEEDMPEPPDWF